MAADNKSLGRFHLVGIPPAPRGVPKIEVTFDIDANGILHVSAKDLGTGKEQKITITGSSGLTKEEIEKMVKEAEEHAEEDKRKREAAEARNRADNLVYTTEKLIRENRDKIPPEDLKRIEKEIENTKKAMESGDVNEINKAIEALTQASHHIAEAIYRGATQQQQTSSQEGTSQQQKGSGDDYIDAEVVDEGDDKKKNN